MRQAIILAGGQGTRLRSVIPDNLPKPMASVAGAPFLQYLLDLLYNYEFQKIILSVGYQHEKISRYFGETYRGMALVYSIEDKALGTGGAILEAMWHTQGEPFFVFNGDSLFYADLWEMARTARNQQARLVMALKRMTGFSRYGAVEWGGNGRITGFLEKEYRNEGYINAGVYYCQPDLFGDGEWPETFSFEEELLQKHFKTLNMHGVATDAYFIDIGIPEDYDRGRADLIPLDMSALRQRLKTEKWTLFLDRDGVVNQRIPGNYIKEISEFRFINKSDEAIVRFSDCFDTIVVVTNQQGAGRSEIFAEGMARVHVYMLEELEEMGGRVDKVYHCAGQSGDNPKCRKPNIGMALQAQSDFPQIDFRNSIMVGDSVSDIRMGKRLGMTTVFVETKDAREVEMAKAEDIDFQYANLWAFAADLLEL